MGIEVPAGKAALDKCRAGLGLARFEAIRTGVGGRSRDPTYTGSASLMMLITGESAEQLEAQTCLITWTVLILLNVAKHDGSHRRRRNDQASDSTEGSEITRQAGEDARTHPTTTRR